MKPTLDPSPAQGGPVEEARIAIWRLFQEGYLDEDMATAGLLVVDVGTRRASRQGARVKAARVEPAPTARPIQAATRPEFGKPVAC